VATTEDRRETDSGIEIKPVYTDEDVAELELELPGEFPFTRGPHKDMCRVKSGQVLHLRIRQDLTPVSFLNGRDGKERAAALIGGPAKSLTAGPQQRSSLID
jgi:hypothetical protein